jgi:hypothetical protein
VFATVVPSRLVTGAIAVRVGIRMPQPSIRHARMHSNYVRAESVVRGRLFQLR